MTAIVRTTEPTQITTREEVHWKKSFSGYSATLWQLNYYFRGPNAGSTPGTGFNAVWATEVTADGNGFDIVVAASKTDDVTIAGVYTWQAWLTEIADSTNKKMVASGQTNIVLGFDSADLTTDTRTPAKIMLDTIDAALLASAGSDTVEYEITTPAGSRRVKRQTREDALNARQYWAGIVTNEIAREGARNGRPLMGSVDMVVYDA